jgi:hypothetical protein
MIFYIEKKVKDNEITKNILSQYNIKKVLYIDNYKNIFDRTLYGAIKKSSIIAQLNNAIIKAPE